MSSKLRAAALTLAAFFIAGHAAAQTPSVDELVAKNLAARGGEAKLKSLNSMKLTGSVSRARHGHAHDRADQAAEQDEAGNDDAGPEGCVRPPTARPCGASTR